MNETKVTRRSFIKISAVAGVTAATYLQPGRTLLATGVAPSDIRELKRIRTACRACGKMECGVWVTVKNGRAIKIEGDQDAKQSFGNICTKSMSSMQAAYHPDRLKYPMKRTRPKGGDPGWVRISWDEALKLSAKKFKEIKAKYGGESIMTMCGTSRMWSMSPYSAYKQLFETPNCVGSYQVCKGPRHFGTKLTDERNYSWAAVVDRPPVYVQWATSPEISNYDDSARVCVDAAQKSQKFITVNPRLANLGKEADIWLPLRPGTDGALALSWIDVIIKNKLYDDLYCKRWTNGPFLHCPDIKPSGGKATNGYGYFFDVKTRLLKESDIKENGSPYRFMVWDKLNNRLTYYDAQIMRWEGETFKVPTKGSHVKGGFLPDPSKFDPEIDPALYGSFSIKLKNGKTVKATPVFELLAKRAAKYSPKVAEKITGVPAEKIELAAKTYGIRVDPRFGNGGIQYQLGVEHATNAVQNVRALAVLVGITGNFDTPGGNRGGTKGPINYDIGAFSMGCPTRPSYDRILGGDRFPLLKWWTFWADATSVWDAVHTGKPYPVKAGICQSGNFANMSNSNYVWDALKKLEFFVDVDLWHHPTSEMADIIFPACHWLELDSPRMSQGSSGGAGANVQCIKPLAEAKPDYEFAELLYKAMGVQWGPDPKNPYPGNKAQLDLAIAGTGMTWKQFKEEFQKNGWIDCKERFPKTWGTYRRYETGAIHAPLDTGAISMQNSGVASYTNKEGDNMDANFEANKIDPNVVPGFNTPTGKQEIWSTVLETFHPKDDFELPTYYEPPESPVANPKLRKKYPLTMITGRRIPVYFHSEHRQLPWCREQWPVPLVEINPVTAAKFGIKHGDWVWIENDRGRVRQKADLYHGIAPDIINCEHQWWFPEMPAPEHGFKYSDINQLVDSHAQDPICGSVNLRAYAVKIYKATEGAPKGIIETAKDKRLKLWAPVEEEV